MAKTLVPVLGDQLSHDLASLPDDDPSGCVVLMMEVWDEATYVKHHPQKIALLFSAMRHFAAELEEKGFSVDYVQLDDEGNTGSFTGEVERALARHDVDAIRIVEAGERRVMDAIAGWEHRFALPVTILPDTRFICSIDEFCAWAQGRSGLRMENFYREMRRKTGLLMDGEEPVEGRWNFDKENRDSADPDTDFPERPTYEPDAITKEVLDLVTERFGDHFGDLDQFAWPVTAKEAQQALDDFIDKRLPGFGATQDAMLTGEDFMNHALLSTSINCGLLDPLAVCRRAEQAYRDGAAPIAAVEGFIRQILGWREYIRGIYWWEDRDYGAANFFGNRRYLPDFYWTGETDMHCIAEAVRTTREHAYAHHIQRLMVLGNFALIAGIDPRQVQDWYLVVYADAYEWVEQPNVVGMALYADGGDMASKPYCASGNYIHKMSDYCGRCRYKVSQKTGEDACPFNALYWDFLDRNRDKLEGNHRIGRIYATWDRMSEERRNEYRDSAKAFLETLTPADEGWAR
ncbi:cryptochrome/photolyase family protein [Sphingomicrobium astaxanthinifaciens]|uniref:cryptochrome/photolyase family protein n=1 Tax=Sphingomicrobium astaxanthinifaciens TaxID=1227949 RepID=UPI001FCAEFCD|nr:cryptochrome/photolyase family protein [Sphingomicrobium astaxanthinifaciens]MCJ7420577.1 cryptochrome/photolyase family protein [Sphingomicrobium astaxanthinifaciens]